MKKSLVFGLIWWLIVFFEVSIIGFTPQLATQNSYGFTLLPAGLALHFLLLTLFSVALAKFHFKTPHPTFATAFRAALIISLVGLILDAVITVPFFVKDYAHYYSKWTLWAGLALFTLVFSVSGSLKWVRS